MIRNIILALVALSFSVVVSAQKVGSSVMGERVTVTSFEQLADSVKVNFTVDFSDFNVESSRSAVFTPVIYSPNKSHNLSPIVLQGRNSKNSFNRAKAVGDTKRLDEFDKLYNNPYKLIPFYGSEKSELAGGELVSYTATLPFERWMVGSEIYLSCSSCGCCKVVDEGMNIPSGNKLSLFSVPSVPVYVVNPKVSLIKPAPVAIKRRDIQYSASLIFKVNSTYIDPALSNNNDVLEELRELIEMVRADKDYTVTAVNIIGYASPEGTIKGNQLLSEGRATALLKRLETQRYFDSRLYSVKFGGENWEALPPLVRASELSESEKLQVNDIIENVSVEDGREAKLMKLNGGAAYRYLLKHIYPLVRVVLVDIEFNVDAYDLERIKEMIGVKPQNLSLEEMYRLSETYEVGSDEFVNLFLTAVNVFPTDEIALNNALVTKINTGNVDAARTYAQTLDSKNKSAVMANTLGVYYMMVGSYDKAEYLLVEAQSLGSEEAIHNLAELKAKVANVKAINEADVLREKYSAPEK